MPPAVPGSVALVGADLPRAPARPAHRRDARDDRREDRRAGQAGRRRQSPALDRQLSLGARLAPSGRVRPRRAAPLWRAGSRYRPTPATSRARRARRGVRGSRGAAPAGPRPAREHIPAAAGLRHEHDPAQRAALRAPRPPALAVRRVRREERGDQRPQIIRNQLCWLDIRPCPRHARDDPSPSRRRVMADHPGDAVTLGTPAARAAALGAGSGATIATNALSVRRSGLLADVPPPAGQWPGSSRATPRTRRPSRAGFRTGRARQSRTREQRQAAVVAAAGAPG